VRKRVAIAGHSEEGMALIPLLEANPDIDVRAILTTEPAEARRKLEGVRAGLGDEYADRMTDDVETALSSLGLVALIDADPSPAIRPALDEAPGRGIQVTTPLIAKLLYAFGPVDASRQPDLLQTLGEILESYNLTIDRRGLLSRILQIAVGATGADRGSLMLHDPATDRLAVEVAIGIEQELIPKIRVRPGEGVAGRAFSEGRAIMLQGKADRERYSVVRERDDVESAISVPLVHEGHALGVLNLSHARERGAFGEEDLAFVEQLAKIDARIITRAEEYHTLLRDSARLRAQEAVDEILSRSAPLSTRLRELCGYVAKEVEGGICHLYMRDDELDVFIMRASSTGLDPIGAPMRLDSEAGIHGWVARTRTQAVLSQQLTEGCGYFAVLPLIAGDRLLGLMSVEGVTRGIAGELLPDRIDAIAETLSRELSDALRAARVEREATKMAAISESAETLNGSADTGELFPAVTSSAAMILEAEHAVLRLQDPASGRFQIRSYFGSAESDAQAELFALEKELSIKAMQRRSALRVINIDTLPEFAQHGADVSTALVQPMQRGGRVVGAITVLGKVTSDPLASECFNHDDEQVLGRLAVQAQQAISYVHEREQTRHHRRFDEVTGLPNAVLLNERLAQEIARASGHDRPLALIRVQIEGLKTVLDTQQEAEGDRLLLSIAQELRAGLRDFDVVARTGDDTFEVLVPEPELDVASLIGPLARRARDAINREPDPSIGENLRLEFGYALYPDEGLSAKNLRDHAATARVVAD